MNTIGYSHTFPASIPGADQSASRAQFLRRTYAHLAGAILLFALLESYLLQLPIAAQFAELATSRFMWLIVLGAFMVVSWVAESFAHNGVSLGEQYFGLLLYVVAEAAIFVPLLYFATKFCGPDLIPTAAIITGLLFAALTAVVFTSGHNFSFLRGALIMACFAAFGFIIASALFGFSLGVAFSMVMILVACGCILYTTSRVLHDYADEQYVSAALSLFASIALLFWYVVRILMRYMPSSSE